MNSHSMYARDVPPTLVGRLLRDVLFIAPALAFPVVMRLLLGRPFPTFVVAWLLAIWIIGRGLERRRVRSTSGVRVVVAVYAGWFGLGSIAGHTLGLWAVGLLGAATIIGLGFVGATFASRQQAHPVPPHGKPPH